MASAGWYDLVENRPIARDVWRMALRGDTGALTRPGQFVNVRVEGFYLRRPISVCSYDGEGLVLIYKVVGGGTRRMAQMVPGQKLDLLVGLGNGFDVEAARGHGTIALVGGGVGLPPLYGAMERLAGERVHCVMGFASAADVFYADAFAALGAQVTITTEDGTMGRKGYVTDALCEMEYGYYLSCGPQPMLRALHRLGGPGQLSFEERMACGFGACMGCACKTLTGTKRICTDGPVFASEEVCFE